MKRFLFTLLCSLFLTACSDNGATFHDTEGHPVQLSKLSGKWVVINYWAPWCPACVWEIPKLNHFYEETKDKDIVLLGVSGDGLPLEQLKKAIADVGITFPVLTEDPHDAWNLPPYDVLPATVILNPQGKVAKIILGPTTDDVLLEEIASLKKA